MTTLTLQHNGPYQADYDMSVITNIAFDLAKNIYNEPDINGNNLDPDDMVMVINFRSGMQATFRAADWSMSFS